MVKAAENNPKAGIRKLADKFRCGKTQISTILCDKGRIIGLYEANMSGDSDSIYKGRIIGFHGANTSGDSHKIKKGSSVCMKQIRLAMAIAERESLLTSSLM